MIGRTLGRYRITAKLGEGGMGTVWLAEDTLLGRRVALKLLSPVLAASDEARHRFLREARAAARLEHPNIATVRDSGEADGNVFIAYQLIEGETLAARLAAGPLPLPDLLRVAIGCADALAHAHERQVIHRDITPTNIMLRGDGSPIIVDFGLARTHGDLTLTQTGTTLGTAMYLAPEQWREESVDARTDLWSLGAVLYLAATGREPFAAENPEAVMYRALNEDPAKSSRVRQDLPPAFVRILLRLLEKDARDRPASAGTLATALRALDPDGSRSLVEQWSPAAALDSLRRWWRRQARRRFGPVHVTALFFAALALTAAGLYLRHQLGERRHRVLAVLPMRIAGGDSTEAGVVGEALGEELVTRFRAASTFRVLPWTTSGRPVPSDVPLTRLASDIRAELLLTGSIHVDDEGMRVQVELIDGHSGRPKWTQEITRPLGDLIGLQTAMVSGVSLHASRSLDGAARARLLASAPKNPEAYEFFIRGGNAWHSGDPNLLPLAEQFFEQAVELDSTLAGAWVALGALRTDRYFRGEGTGKADLTVAGEMFRRALRSSPGLPAAERGLIRQFNEMRAIFSGGTYEILEIAGRALARDPDDVDQLTTAAIGFMLGGLAELALPIVEHALKLDPDNQRLAWNRSVILSWSGQPARCRDAALEYLKRYGEDLEIYTWLGGAEFSLHNDAAAFQYLTRAVELAAQSPVHYSIRILARLYLDTGHRKECEELLTSIRLGLIRQLAATPNNERLHETMVASYALLGDTSEYKVALAQARRALMDPHWDVLPRILAEGGLVEEAKATARARRPPWEQHWVDAVDPLGGERIKRLPGIVALLASPEYTDSQDLIDATRVVAFNRYRAIVAKALPREPDVPGPRLRWPR